jgi:hypothetical protein
LRLASDHAGPRLIPDLTASAGVIVSDPAEGLVVRKQSSENDKAIVCAKHDGHHRKS